MPTVAAQRTLRGRAQPVDRHPLVTADVDDVYGAMADGTPPDTRCRTCGRRLAYRVLRRADGTVVSAFAAHIGRRT